MNTGIRSEPVDELFSERATLSRYLVVEAGLARVQAAMGIIPDAAAEAICEVSVEDIDTDRFARAFEHVGFPVVGLVKQLVDLTPGGWGEHAHWGATTQDIMDTALVLGLRDVLDWVGSGLEQLVSALGRLAREHQWTPMVGRSQLQHAVPITFGYKVATWLTPLLRHRARLQQLRPRLLQVQLGGAVGTLASLGVHGEEVRRRLADELGLEPPITSWHTQRDTLAECVCVFGMLGGSLAKIATDIVLMAQTDVAELREPSSPGRGTSSTMPQKRNPILSQQAIVAARLLRGQVAAILEVMPQDHERGSGSWQTEWTVIPDAASYTLAIVDRVLELVSGLVVQPWRMRENLASAGVGIHSEAIMMRLAPTMGRQRAHDIVAKAVSGNPSPSELAQSLLSVDEVREVVSESEILRLLEGSVEFEAAARAVDEVLVHRSRQLAGQEVSV